MISVQDAFSILKNNLPESKEVEYSLVQARKHVLSQNLYSPINMPPFRQSAMDGFALCLHDSLEYEIISEIKAGDTHQVNLLSGQAVKIFTGAAVPGSQATLRLCGWARPRLGARASRPPGRRAGHPPPAWRPWPWQARSP